MVVELKKINAFTWEIPLDRREGMLVPGRIYANEALLKKMRSDRTLEQCRNVACLPGIQRYSVTLPDGHEGYGFPIGGVAAFSLDDGVISPGGIGYDINCGVRILSTPFSHEEVGSRLKELLDTLFRLIPCGVGAKSKMKISVQELDRVLVEGVEWAIEKGFGYPEDSERLEENGRMEGADPSAVSERAKQRGRPQLGTLGAGNHFLEIQMVDKIYDPETAKVFGLPGEGGVTVMIHTGSRGLGHEVCGDYIRILERAAKKYNIRPKDRELVYAPWGSREAEKYFSAMACAVNYAFANRHMVMHWVREAFKKIFGSGEELKLIYGVCHNIGKIEEHEVNGKRMKLIVHRKGATRAFPPGRPEIPQPYREAGQPVIIPGSMGTASYILVGTREGEKLAFASTAHGAGRTMSRRKAVRMFRGSEVASRLAGRGIIVKAASIKVVAEETPEAYKDIDLVAEVSHRAGLARKVARLVPLGVVKG